MSGITKRRRLPLTATVSGKTHNIIGWIQEYQRVRAELDVAVGLLRELDKWSDDKFAGTVGLQQAVDANKSFLAKHKEQV